MLHEDYLAAGTLQLVQDEGLVRVLAGQAIGRKDRDEIEGPRLRIVSEAVEPRPVQARPTEAAITVHVRVVEPVSLLLDPGPQDGQWAVDRLLQFLAFGRHPGVDSRC